MATRKFLYFDTDALTTEQDATDSLTLGSLTLSGGVAGSVGLDMGGMRVSNAADPQSGTDLATRQWVESVMYGMDWKAATRAATTANITSLSTGAPLVVDGVTVANGDRILVKNQTTGSENGIYVVNSAGTGANGVWARAVDADASAEVTAGMAVWVTEGTTQADSGWALTTDDPITLGTTSLAFVQISGAGQITAGAGLTKTGNTLDVGANADGSITVNANDIQVGVLATDAQHGNRGGGSIHALAVAGGAAGFLSGSDKTKLDSVTSGASVSSVALSLPADFNVSGSPVTTSGTLTAAWASVAAGNRFLASPNGSSGTPSFRAIVAADIPTLNQNTTGTASNVTGTVAIANGGTGQTAKAAAFNALSPVTTLGDLIYGDGANSNNRVAGNTTSTKKFLTQTGTGTVSAAPGWNTIAAADVPTLNQNTTGSAGSVANALTLNNGGAGAASGSTFNGSAAVTLSYNTIGAVPTTRTISTDANTLSGGGDLSANRTFAVIGVPSLFKINNVAVGANVTAPNLDTLTSGGATTLHYHNGLDVAATTDATGVTKGDALYYSGNGIVSRGDNNKSTLAKSRIIGLATATVGASTAMTYRTHGVLTGAISGATAGTEYFLSSTGAPVTLGSLGTGVRRVRVGIAVNATDLLITLERGGQTV
jgi:hypothetical protein